MTAALVSIDYTHEELSVLAELLDVDALPGSDPDLLVSDEAKATAARGLIARGVLRLVGDEGLEITTPHAALISLALAAEQIIAVHRLPPGEHGELDAVQHAWYRGGGRIVYQRSSLVGQTWALVEDVASDELPAGVLDGSMTEGAAARDDEEGAQLHVTRIWYVGGTLEAEEEVWERQEGIWSLSDGSGGSPGTRAESRTVQRTPDQGRRT